MLNYEATAFKSILISAEIRKTDTKNNELFNSCFSFDARHDSFYKDAQVRRYGNMNIIKK